MIRELDEASLERFVSFWLGESAAPEHLREKVAKVLWMRERHLALTPDSPFGWIAESEGRIIAGKLALATPLICGTSRVVAMMSSSFRVDPEFSGIAAMLFKQYMALGTRYPLIATSTNEESARLWRAFRASPIQGGQSEWLLIGNGKGAREEGWFQRTGKARLARVMASFSKEVPAEPLPIGRSEDLTQRQAPETWRVEWDHRYLSWRVDHCPTPGLTLSKLGEATVAWRLDMAGHRSQMRVIRLLAWSHPPAVWLDSACRWAPASDGVIASYVQPDEAEIFVRAGFTSKVLPASLGWVIDKASHLGERPLRLSALDSDLYV